MTQQTPISKLRKWREERRWTQEQCAKQIGTSRQVWCDWERGRRIPDRSFMPKIVKLTQGEITPDAFYPQIDDAA